jgi:hypothetical protein
VHLLQHVSINIHTMHSGTRRHHVVTQMRVSAGTGDTLLTSGCRRRPSSHRSDTNQKFARITIRSDKVLVRLHSHSWHLLVRLSGMQGRRVLIQRSANTLYVSVVLPNHLMIGRRVGARLTAGSRPGVVALLSSIPFEASRPEWGSNPELLDDEASRWWLTEDRLLKPGALLGAYRKHRHETNLQHGAVPCLQAYKLRNAPSRWRRSSRRTADSAPAARAYRQSSATGAVNCWLQPDIWRY